MGYVCSALLLFIFLLARKLDFKGKVKLTLDKVFLVYWLLITFGGCLHLYGLYDIDDFVYILEMLGCLSFFFGYHLSKKKLRNYQNTVRTSIRFKPVFYLVLLISLFIIFRQVLLLLPIILARGMADARGDMQLDDSLVLSGGMDILLAYFAKPFVKASIIVLIVNSFKTKFSVKIFSLILLLLGMYFFSEGGRAVIMEVFFALVFCLYVDKKNISRKVKRRIKSAIIIIAILPILATLERGSDTFFSIYTYYCGSLQYLSQALKFRYAEFNDYLWGLASFQGFIKPVFGILQVFGLPKPDELQQASDFVILAQTTVYDIAPNCEMNYFFTTFGYAYKDGGVLGNIIIHFIFGVMSCLVDLKVKSGSSEIVRWMSIKAVFFYSILFSMSYFPFGMYLNAMTIIYIFLISSNIFTRKIYGKVN